MELTDKSVVLPWKSNSDLPSIVRKQYDKCEMECKRSSLDSFGDLALKAIVNGQSTGELLHDLLTVVRFDFDVGHAMRGSFK